MIFCQIQPKNSAQICQISAKIQHLAIKFANSRTLKSVNSNHFEKFRLKIHLFKCFITSYE